MKEKNFKIGDKVKFDLEQIKACCPRSNYMQICIKCPIYNGETYGVVNFRNGGTDIYIKGPNQKCNTWSMTASFPSVYFDRAYDWRKL